MSESNCYTINEDTSFSCLSGTDPYSADPVQVLQNKPLIQTLYYNARYVDYSTIRLFG